ncbi:17374_t:CDS:1, partial [Acaulospora colombiana]
SNNIEEETALANSNTTNIKNNRLVTKCKIHYYISKEIFDLIDSNTKMDLEEKGKGSQEENAR